MTADENPITCEPIETALRALEKQDAVAAASAFAADGRFVDPQFPDTEYRGQERVREALEWALTNIGRRPEFEIRLFLEHEGTCALEVESRQVRPDDSSVRSRKAFFVEVGADGITRWRTYLSYTPDDGARPGHGPRPGHELIR